MTYEKILEIFKDYSLTRSFSSGVYFMKERIGYIDYVPSHWGHDYHFVPQKDDPDNIENYDLINQEEELRRFFDRKALWFKQIKEKKRAEQLQEDFK